ncbi:MAG: hypothetical protein HUU60_07620 [Armatimonadetes bacterium]|nr:hypothetical protein [Armatimonadota bacterium]
MKRTLFFALTSLALVGMACAQPPNMTPEMRKRMEAWTKFRDQHKNTQQLSGLVRGMARLQEEGKPLDAKQSKAVVAILEPLSKKPKLTQDDARKTQMALQKTLTAAQLNTISRARTQDRQRMGGGGGNSGGGGARPNGAPGGGNNRPGGAGGGQGRGMMDLDPAKLKDYNPFYTGAKPAASFLERGQNEFKQFLAELKKKAK